MDNADEMTVIKRDKSVKIISFDKILTRIKRLGSEFSISLNYTMLAMKVIEQLYNNITTQQIDEFLAEHCAVSSTIHPHYGILAKALIISNHQKNTKNSLLYVCTVLYDNNINPKINTNYFNLVSANYEEYENMIDYQRDYLIDYFGFKTLEKAYLLKMNGQCIERIQHLWMRVAICLHGNNFDKVKESYDLLSQKYFIHATPTLFNAGTLNQQLSSCYLLAMEEDSLDGIYNTLHDCASISKYAGGIGLHIHNIRAAKSYIHGTNGNTTSIVPMLRMFNQSARFINQGGKRNGSYAIYLEPWHADIELFLDLKKNHGDDDSRARDLFYGLWVPDLFMERVHNNEMWSLFSNDDAPGLHDVCGDEFKALYLKYEEANKQRTQISAQTLWLKILDSQMETGMPYLLYKDACNIKSNQQNLGTIKSSNLCCEIIEYSDDKESAVCNLASIGLPTFVLPDKTFDFDKLLSVVQVIAENLNKVIDISFYPTSKTSNSNLKHRPIGIGVQGLADVFLLMDMPFCSKEAKELNTLIFETIYFGALTKSCELAHIQGPYSSYTGSPASKGLLQFDLWNVVPSTRYDWDGLKKNIELYGLRNSLLIAPMPTATTSQIFGFNECFEPITSNMYSRSTLAGEFMVINKYLMQELIELDCWNTDIKQSIIEHNGSIQHLTQLSEHVREKYKIVWEMSMKHIIDMAADRGAFVCQSQSMNLWQANPTYASLTSMHFYSWKKGLKTGMYYLRRKAVHQQQQFTIEPGKTTMVNNTKVDDPECEMCSG